jgi:hypothetical protein
MSLGPGKAIAVREGNPGTFRIQPVGGRDLVLRAVSKD